jgi:signal transduction histidine kinase/CheY-like chemotaxis protein
MTNFSGIFYGNRLERKRIIKDNLFFYKLLWMVTIFSFTISYFIHFATIQKVNALYIVSGVVVYLVLIIAKYLIVKQEINLLNYVFVIGVNSTIFFYDIILGAQLGVYFHYFSYIIAIFGLFKWNRDNKWIIAIVTLPIFYLLVTFLLRALFVLPLYTYNQQWVNRDFMINCCIAFIVILIQIIYYTYQIVDFENRFVHNEIYLKTLLETTSATIMSFNTDYIITSYNQKYEHVIQKNYQKEIFVGFNIKTELFPLPNNPKVLQNVYEKVLGGEKIILEYWSNGVPYEVMGTPIFDKNNNITGAIMYDRDITDKTEKEIALEQQSLNLQTLVDNTNGFIWSIDQNYKVIAVNKAMKKSMRTFFKTNFEIGFNILDLHDNKDFPELFKAHHKKVMQGEKIAEEYAFAGNFYEVYGTPLLDQTGNISGATFYNVNVTDRKKNQLRLEEFTSNLQSLIDNSNDSFWSVDTNYKIITASKTFVEDTKRYFNTEIYIGYNMQQFFKQPTYPAEWEGYYTAIFNGGEINLQYDFNHKVYTLTARPIYNVDQKIIGAAFYASDITDKSLNEKKLQQSEINLQSLIDTNNGIIWGIDADYKLLACSAKYKLIAKEKYNLDVDIGFDVRAFFNQADYIRAFETFYNQILKGNTIFEIIEDNGLLFEVTGKPIMNDGMVVGAALYSDDVTLKKKAEREIIAAIEKAEEATRVKARFLSNMSHELRTPLNGVIGITNLICAEPILEQQKEHLEILKYSSDHMLSLVNDILDFSKIEEGKINLEKSVINIGATISKTTILFSKEAQDKGLQLNVQCAEELYYIDLLGDITRLRQILNNLINNAIKFTDKGSVAVQIEKVSTQQWEYAMVKFTITDTGIGISANNQSKIFDSFTQADPDTTRKYGGTGLGLTISRKLIELMGGQLKVESTIGMGSSFSFTIPLHYADFNQTTTTKEEVLVMDAFDNLSILVAEDNKINMLVVRRNLEKWNIKIEAAENGKEACTLFEQKHFDLILMDMEMPIMDGLAATDYIRNKNTTIPIIALTAASFENMQENLREKGINDYIQKPFAPEDLYRKICKHIVFS